MPRPTLSQPLRFGLFIPPIQSPGESPTLLLERNLELIQHCDRLGYHEAWIGEHHSSGSELIASPEVFIAAAAQRTRNIRLGTGVNSLPYHHPFILADRIVMLDHLTRGRTMFGVGPGQLTSDAMMLGIDPATQRLREHLSCAAQPSVRAADLRSRLDRLCAVHRTGALGDHHQAEGPTARKPAGLFAFGECRCLNCLKSKRPAWD